MKPGGHLVAAKGPNPWVWFFHQIRVSIPVAAQDFLIVTLVIACFQRIKSSGINRIDRLYTTQTCTSLLQPKSFLQVPSSFTLQCVYLLMQIAAVFKA